MHSIDLESNPVFYGATAVHDMLLEYARPYSLILSPGEACRRKVVAARPPRISSKHRQQHLSPQAPALLRASSPAPRLRVSRSTFTCTAILFLLSCDQSSASLAASLTRSSNRRIIPRPRQPITRRVRLVRAYHPSGLSACIYSLHPSCRPNRSLVAHTKAHPRHFTIVSCCPTRPPAPRIAKQVRTYHTYTHSRRSKPERLPALVPQRPLSRSSPPPKKRTVSIARTPRCADHLSPPAPSNPLSPTHPTYLRSSLPSARPSSLPSFDSFLVAIVAATHHYQTPCPAPSLPAAPPPPSPSPSRRSRRAASAARAATTPSALAASFLGKYSPQQACRLHGEDARERFAC